MTHFSSLSPIIRQHPLGHFLADDAVFQQPGDRLFHGHHAELGPGRNDALQVVAGPFADQIGTASVEVRISQATRLPPSSVGTNS